MILGFNRDVKEAVARAQYGYCRYCTAAIIEFDHIVPNTKTNRALFPIFLQSPFNCAGVSRNCHELKSIVMMKHMRISYEEAMMYEAYLTSYATLWYNLGKEEYRNGNTNNLSVSELRERKDLPALTEKVLSESG